MATNEMRSDSAPPAPSAPGLTHHGAPPDHRRPQPRALAEALQGARGSAMRDSQSVSSDPPSEEDYDENVRPAFTSGPDHPGGIQRRSHLQQGTRSPNIRRNDSGIHIFPEDEKAVQDLLKRSSQRVKDPKAVHRNSRFSNLVFTAQFSAFDRNNEAAASSPFHGFYTLFWLAVALFVVKMSADNWREYGHPLGTNDIMKTMFRRDVVVLLLSDGLMCSLTGISWLLQKVVLHSYISWDRSGWVIQNIWQTVFIACVITWPHIRDWPWTHTVFFVMHGIVMLMKQHSYAFYNGYLSTVYKTRKRLLSKLKDLEHVDPVSPGSSEIPPIETSYLDAPPSAMQRRKSLSKVPQDEETSIDKIARAIASGDTLNDEQIQLFERVIKWEIDALADELKGTASDQSGAYPRNLTFMDHYKYIPLPTVVYEISYPRSETINWSNVAEKTVAMFGIIFVMIQVSQRYIYPIVMKTVEMKESGMPFVDRFKEFPWLLSDLIFPFMMEYLLSWYLIWETILNILAELTYFADRSFYDAWWNSVSWDQFARDWNRPVHTFLLRHVYHSSISSMKVNKHTATLITFFLSACIHEVIMWCIFKKLRGYLLVLQMCQLPLVRLSRTKWLKGRKTLGNLIFWLGIFTGPSVLCSLYLIL